MKTLKVPKARKLQSGTWFIQLRFKDEPSIPISGKTEREVILEAQRVKAEHLAGKRMGIIEDVPETPYLILRDACLAFIEKRSNSLSPSTIRGYNYIVKNRFCGLMDKNVYEITESDWIISCNHEASLCSPKTLANSWGFVSTVLRQEAKMSPPKVTLPQASPNERPFLNAEEIKVFVKAIKGTEVEIAALLALSSMRRSEICALRWENIDLKKRLIHVKGAAVFNSEEQLVQKSSNKNKSSTRTIPIMMDELYSALNRQKRESGVVVTSHPNMIRKRINRICESNGLPKVGTHGLRHSFASLAKHIGMPEQVTMQIGGWSDYQTMRKIYTHISQKDADRYKNAMSDFYNKKPKNANKNANSF